MSVKIDKYRLHNQSNGSAIYDLSTGYKIVYIELMKNDAREKLAKHILDELNTGKYEEDRV